MKRFCFIVILLMLFLSCTNKSPSHFFKNGSAQYQLKNYTGALENLNRAIKLNGNYKEAYYLRALCNINLDEPEEALTDFNKAIQLDSTYKEAYFNRAFYIKDKQGDYAGSIRDYNQFIRLNAGNNNAFALNNRGFAKYKLNDAKGALTDIEASLKSDPKNAYAYKNLALVFISLDSLNLACENLELSINHGYAVLYDDEVTRLIDEYCSN